ncbi:Haloacid dehalogenase, type II [Candidatus Rhodobacter oscarellae]|uniref:(S)-2-haloacid dehalogenase n=1 Tax=Candidatus Rhodobacter oscarellae TaxID=1675527 RepID=A0A0J9E0S9_9RHOB|nr:haloacid dehalogenase type II [Candidatus Rhodobacter lobularis]KMW56330.1 Haloacid dehalogenase, type II [Candidatus Rhodobacter lobularis]
MTQPRAVKALLFDVFGTVVDWRSSVAVELQSALAPRGHQLDWEAMADDWRGRYQPAMQAIRSGARGYTILDVLHRENLDATLRAFGVTGLSEAELIELNEAWHRLRPWPDCVPGLGRLKRDFILGTLSNGNIALMVNLARFGSLPWDVILGAEITRSYKPSEATYLGSAAALGLAPGDCMMVAAHNEDLRAAQRLGMATAFVCRPTEHGPGQEVDLAPDGDWDYAAHSMQELADLLARA